jgi:hypothetical protein
LIIPQLLFSGVIVKFDKLHPTFASQSGVPIIGNVMASRWAYEALAVYQFKNNDYDRMFFEYDTKASQFSWKRDFWTKEMRTIVSDSRKLLSSGEEAAQLEENRQILINELVKETKTVKGFEVNYLNSEGKLNDAMLDSIESSIDLLYEYYKANYRQVVREKDAMNNRLTATAEKRDSVIAIKDAHHNDKLEEFVTNNGDIKRLVTYSGELVQKIDPIYQVPTHKSFFGAHFYAPSKNFFGKQITTFSANLGMIWFMTFLLMVLLCMDGMRKFIELISDLPEMIRVRLPQK